MLVANEHVTYRHLLPDTWLAGMATLEMIEDWPHLDAWITGTAYLFRRGPVVPKCEVLVELCINERRIANLNMDPAGWLEDTVQDCQLSTRLEKGENAFLRLTRNAADGEDIVGVMLIKFDIVEMPA